MEPQNIQNSQSDPEKAKLRSLIFLDFNPYYKAVVMKTVWYRHKMKHLRSMEQKRNLKTDLQLYTVNKA